MMGPCAKQTVRATIITPEGERITGTNWCENPQVECPRGNMPTGQGYELCREVCGQKNHAEVDACLKAGEKAKGGTLYLEGHSYCCPPCLKVMKEHGIASVVIGEPPTAYEGNAPTAVPAIVFLEEE